MIRWRDSRVTMTQRVMTSPTSCWRSSKRWERGTHFHHTCSNPLLLTSPASWFAMCSPASRAAMKKVQDSLTAFRAVLVLLRSVTVLAGVGFSIVAVLSPKSLAISICSKLCCHAAKFLLTKTTMSDTSWMCQLGNGQLRFSIGSPSMMAVCLSAGVAHQDEIGHQVEVPAEERHRAPGWPRHHLQALQRRDGVLRRNRVSQRRPVLGYGRKASSSGASAVLRRLWAIEPEQTTFQAAGADARWIFEAPPTTLVRAGRTPCPCEEVAEGGADCLQGRLWRSVASLRLCIPACSDILWCETRCSTNGLQ